MPSEPSQEKSKATLDTISRESQKPLFAIKAIWPFDIFPDEIQLDRQTVTIIRRIFWGIEEKLICHYDDLVNAHVNTGLLFSSISILSKYFTDGEETVTRFSRKDARKMHALLQGLLIARKEGIDLTDLPTDKMVEKLYQIGNR